MKHIQTWEGFLTEGINHQNLLKKMSDILGPKYMVSYDKKK